LEVSNWVSGQQLAFLFIILDVFIRYTGSFGGLNLEIDTLVIDYLMIVFFVIGMSGIKLRPVLLSLLAAFVLAWLIRTIQTPYMLPQVAGFQIDLTYHSMNDFLNMCVMLFCGRLLRRRIGMDRALLTSAWLPVAFLLLSFTLFSSVGFSYQLVDDVTDMALNASFGLGSPTGQVALMFVLASGRKACRLDRGSHLGLYSSRAADLTLGGSYRMELCIRRGASHGASPARNLEPVLVRPVSSDWADGSIRPGVGVWSA
jgi:hypothetical protein